MGRRSRGSGSSGAFFALALPSRERRPRHARPVWWRCRGPRRRRGRRDMAGKAAQELAELRTRLAGEADGSPAAGLAGQVCGKLRKHPDHARVQEHGCAVLRTLACDSGPPRGNTPLREPPACQHSPPHPVEGNPSVRGRGVQPSVTRRKLAMACDSDHTIRGPWILSPSGGRKGVQPGLAALPQLLELCARDGWKGAQERVVSLPRSGCRIVRAARRFVCVAAGAPDGEMPGLQCVLSGSTSRFDPKTGAPLKGGHAKAGAALVSRSVP